MAIRVPINLAREPFRRDRPALVGLVAAAVVSALLLAFLLMRMVSQRHEAADTRATISRLNAQIHALDADQAKLNALLRKPENAAVLERSVFLNTLIDRKFISWTKIFSDLDKVMPWNVRLMSVRLPEVNTSNEVLLDMFVGAKEVAPVLEFLKRLEASPQFGPTSVLNSAPPSLNDPFYRFHVSVRYAQKL
jgi:type IV pilus assembly protein PilN